MPVFSIRNKHFLQTLIGLHIKSVKFKFQESIKEEYLRSVSNRWTNDSEKWIAIPHVSFPLNGLICHPLECCCFLTTFWAQPHGKTSSGCNFVQSTENILLRSKGSAEQLGCRLCFGFCVKNGNGTVPLPLRTVRKFLVLVVCLLVIFITKYQSQQREPIFRSIVVGGLDLSYWNGDFRLLLC